MYLANRFILAVANLCKNCNKQIYRGWAIRPDYTSIQWYATTPTRLSGLCTGYLDKPEPRFARHEPYTKEDSEVLEDMRR